MRRIVRVVLVGLFAIFLSAGLVSPASADVSIRNANGLLLDFHDAYGAYVFFAEDVAFRRWISSSGPPTPP